MEPRNCASPVELILNAAVVAPTDATETTLNKSKLESEEVAEIVKTARGEVEPIPTLVAPAV